MSKLAKGFINAISLKNRVKKQVNSERDFFNKKDRQFQGYIEGKTKYGMNKLQNYKPEAGDKSNPIAKLIKIFEQTLSKGEPLLSKFSNFYLSKGDLLHYIPRTILLFLSIFIIITEVILLLISPVIEAIPFIGPPLLKLLQFFSLPKELYFMFYGGIKFILCFTILLSVIILIKQREKYFNASMKDILFLFIVFVINLLPYLYDLLSYIIHLGIMDGFYRYKCQRDSEANEKVIANKFNLIALLEFGILLIGLISFLYYFLRHYFYPSVKKDDTNPWYIESLPLFMFFVPILYLGILYICNFIEKELSDMVLTNMGSMDEDIPDEKNCVAGPGQCEDSDDNKLTGLLKLFIYGGISFFIVILQRTSLSRAIRNVLEQTITTNIILIQKIIGINIKIKNDTGEEEEMDINEFEKNRNISDFSYGEEIRKKLEKINTRNISKNSKPEDLSVEDCENISKLKVIYNNLKKQHDLYNDSSPNYNKEKLDIINRDIEQFIVKLGGMGIKQYTIQNIFNNDIFTNNSLLQNLINICNERMKQLDSASLLGSNADFTKIQKDKEFIENDIKIYNDKIKSYEKEIFDVGLAISELPVEDKINRNELKKKQEKLQYELKNLKYNLQKKEKSKTKAMKTLDKNIENAGNAAKVIKEQKETEAKNYDFNNIVQDNEAIRNISERKELFDKKKEELDDSTLKFNQSKQQVIEAEKKEKAAEKATKRRLFGLLPPSSKNTKKLEEAKKETFDAKVNSEISKRELDNVEKEYEQSEQKITEANDAKARRELTKTNNQLNNSFRNARKKELDKSTKLVDNTISNNSQ